MRAAKNLNRPTQKIEENLTKWVLIWTMGLFLNRILYLVETLEFT
jgi:hypothetical protein